MDSQNNNTWGFSEVWNNALLEQRKGKSKEPRKNIWASELGKATIDIVLAMRGVEPSNPPNARSLRKFEAGNIWEWIVSLILIRAGVLRSQQHWCSHQFPGLAEVTGKADFIAGGTPDLDKAKEALAELNLPDIFQRGGESIISYLEEKYPNGLVEQPLEIKSTSAFMFDVYEQKESASENHQIQLYHYLVSMNYPKGTIVYISRDDCRMMEIPVLLDSHVGEAYKLAIENVSKWTSGDKLPPKEQPIVYDQQLIKFSKNWKVGYSNYLTKIYGYKDQKEFDDKYTSVASRWNRVVNRVKEGKNMTKKNKEVLAEIKQAGFNINLLTK